MNKAFKTKEFKKWFEELEVIAKKEYLIANLKKKDFLEYYKEGKSFYQSIETFLYK